MNYCEIDVMFKRVLSTGKSVLVSDGDLDVLLPLSQCRWHGESMYELPEPGEDTTVTIPEWLALKKGLI